MESIASQHTNDMHAAVVAELNELLNGVSVLTSSTTNLMISVKSIWKAMLEEESTKLAYSAFKKDVNGTGNCSYLKRVFAYMLRQKRSSLAYLTPADFYNLLHADFPAISTPEKTYVQEAFNLDE